MTLVEFLAQLRSLDVKLWVEDDRLRVNAPAGVLTPALRVELAARKAEVIAFLQGTQTRLHAAATPIAPVSRADPLPLSFAQQRMWFLYQLDPDSSFYNIPIAVRLNGPLDPALLEKGLNAVVSRHESLRTTFTLAAEQAVQVIAPELAIPLTIIDLRAAPAREHEAQQYLLREVTRPFDLATGPLLRATLLQLADEEHVLLLTMHHIVSDSWSGYVLVRELAALYQAERAGEPSPLPALPIQYADFAVWQRGWLRGEFLEAQLAYWKQQLAGASGVLDLPSDHPRPAVQSFRGSMQAFVLPETLHEALNALSRREGVTLFMTLLAAFNVVLNRYSAQADIVVGSPIANRSRSELEGLIGVFVNTLALRTNLGGDPTFTALLARVRDATLGAYAHQDLPFELLVEELRPERDLSRSPIFQVMFVFQNTPKTSVELSGLTLSPLEVDRGTAQFDLTLVMDETDHGLAGALEYNTDLFEAATIARLIAHFQIVLEAIAADPDRRIAQLPLLTDAERRQVLVEWNATQVEYRHDRCIQQLFEEQAERTPDAAAVVFADRQLTYRELNERANCLAHYLQHLGVKPEVLVGLCLERSLELLVGLLGILKAGGTYVPLDPSYPAERLSDMLADSGVPVLLTQAHLADRLHALRTTQYGIRIPYSVLRLDTDWPAIAQSAVSNPQAPISPDNLAYVIYTSGSTGRPKGVAVSHRNLVHSTLARMAYYPEAVTGFLLLSSFAFDSSLAGIFWTLCQGGRLILPEPGAEKDVPAFSALMAQRHPSHLLCVPNLYALLLAEAQPQLQELRVVIVAGEACSPELVEQHARLLPQTRLFNEYGPTEAAVWCSVYDCRVLASGAQVPIGRPIANTQLYILDAHLNPTPVGVPGELHVGGLGLARGYLNRPDLTAEKFIPNPFFDEGRRTTDEGRNAGSAPLSSFVHRHSSSRLYRTGDLARWRPDGNLEFLGRIDQQVKVRGFRIELGEIEAALAEHPAVREALVVAQTDRTGDKRLVAYLIPKPDSLSSSFVSELRAFLRAKLPEHMLPSAFVVLEAFPLTPNGKVDRKALPAPDETRPSSQEAYAPPRTELERTIAAVWQSVLQVEQVGLDDNFFDLGGHSMRMVQAHSQLQKLLERKLTMVELFKYPTVRALAAHLHPDGTGVATGVQRGRQIAQERKDALARTSPPDIAIIGMAGRFPKAATTEEFWRNLQNGVEGISTFSAEELQAAGIDPVALNQPNYVRAFGALADVDQFDAAFFGFNPREAEYLDPQQRIFLECAWEALENAGYNPAACPGRVGVYAGINVNMYLLNLYSRRDLVEAIGPYQLQLANDKDYLATRVSYKLNLKGPSMTVQTACSTSLVAVHLACQSLVNHECRTALAGGVAVSVPSKSGYLYQEGGIASPDGHCRAFDARAQGTVSGNGVGIVVLKRLADALADGDRVLAVIKGSAINNDGSDKAGYTAPSVEGQTEVITEALALSGIEPETIGYVEAHGTGTPLGDPIELEALTQAFRAYTDKPGFCALGSVKTNIGHLDAAAGVAGLIKTTLALHYQRIPPSLHFERPNPHIDFEHSPFYVNTQLAEWTANGAPRRAGVSSFGMGGTNAHVVLEEAPAVEPSGPSRPWQLLTLSAKTTSALETATANLAAYLRRTPDVKLADVAYTLQTGRSAFKQRRILVCRDGADATTALEQGMSRRVFTGEANANSPSVAFMFPGQGAQHSNMGRALYETEPVFRAEVDRCAELLQPLLGVDIRQVVYPPLDSPAAPSDAALDQTALAQPALFAWEYALAKLWLAWGIHPQALIGHSIGEYVAACLAGVFSLEDALKLVATRGQLMQSLPAGAMLAVFLPEPDVRPLLDPALSLAAVNGPAACVVSGSMEAVAALEQRLAARAIDCRRLHTSHAFHSDMMEPILESFAAQVEQVARHAPQLPFISNVTGKWISAAEATDPKYWAAHLRQTVRFADGLQVLRQEPQRVLLEVGPGQTLSALAQARSETQAIPSLPHPRDQRSDAAAALEALGRLWLSGVPVDWAAFYTDERRQRAALPTYPFERQRYWIERQNLPDQRDPRSVTLHKRPDLADWFYLLTWKRSQLLQLPGPEELTEKPRRWLVFVDDCGVGARLVERLVQEHQGVTLVKAGEQFARDGAGTYTLNPQNAEDYRALIAELQASNQAPHIIVHLWSVTPDDSVRPGIDFYRQTQGRGFYSLLFLAQALGVQGITDTLRLGVISNHVHAVTGNETLSPAKATIVGACKVIPLEYPNLTCCNFDVVLPTANPRSEAILTEQIIAEMITPSAAPVSAYREPCRWEPSLEPTRLAKPDRTPLRLKEKGVYLITGGLGGMGLTFAEYLAEKVRARLILVSRTALPERAEWAHWLATHDDQDATWQRLQRVQHLESLGAEVLVFSADVADLEQMQAVVAQAQARWGRIDGVIHTAGLADYAGVIQRRTLAATESVMAPKVYGLLVLEQLLGNSPPDFTVVCSSLSAILYKTKFGQVGYCAANEFLDAYAHYQTFRNGPLTVSINWDDWQTVGMSVEAARKQSGQMVGPFDLEAELLEGLLPQEGVGVLERILENPAPQVAVSARDLLIRLEQHTAYKIAEWLADDSLAHPAHARPELSVAYVAPRTEVERRIAEIWQRLLGIEPIGVDDNFFELGGHSLLATRVLAHMRTDLHVNLSLPTLFEFPTVAGLAAQLETMARTEPLPAIVPIKPADNLSLEDVDDLSDEQVSALLKKLLAEEQA